MHGYPQDRVFTGIVEGTERRFIALSAVSLHLGAEIGIGGSVGHSRKVLV
jgi:hypothetical protein